MRKISTFFILVILSVGQVLAVGRDDLTNHGAPPGTILSDTSLGFVGILSLIQSVLLKIVLPIVLVGSALYIAYQLFTAEGDETKMKKAGKSIGYSAIALIAIALSYAIVTILSSLSL